MISLQQSQRLLKLLKHLKFSDNFNYLDNFMSTLNDIILSAELKGVVDVATTSNITLSGEQTIDGVLTNKTRILVKNQTNPQDNGIYVTDNSTWARDNIFYDNVSPYIKSGDKIYVINGTLNKKTTWSLLDNKVAVVGKDDLVFAKVNIVTDAQADVAIDIENDTISVRYDDNTLKLSNNNLRINSEIIDQINQAENLLDNLLIVEEFVYSNSNQSIVLTNPILDMESTVGLNINSTYLNPTYSITSGSLPNGVTLDSSTGTISGTPIEAGTFNFTVTITFSKLLDPATNINSIVIT